MQQESNKIPVDTLAKRFSFNLLKWIISSVISKRVSKWDQTRNHTLDIY